MTEISDWDELEVALSGLVVGFRGRLPESWPDAYLEYVKVGEYGIGFAALCYAILKVDASISETEYRTFAEVGRFMILSPDVEEHQWGDLKSKVRADT